MVHATCSTCGVSFEYERRGPGRPRKFCDEHRRVDLRRRSAPRAERRREDCAVCGDALLGHASQVYCSPACRDKAAWQRRARIPCSSCGEPTGWSLARPDRDGARCNSCRVREGRHRESCACCGEDFESRRRSDGRWTRYCSKSCRMRDEVRAGRHEFISAEALMTEEQRAAAKFRNAERSRRKRRARLAEVESEPYTLAEIAERDGFRCGLCGEIVDMSLKFPHPKSASVDHIIPLSRPGSSDLKTNVRLAHLGENVARGNREECEQPLLIG